MLTYKIPFHPYLVNVVRHSDGLRSIHATFLVLEEAQNFAYGIAHTTDESCTIAIYQRDEENLETPMHLIGKVTRERSTR